MEEEEEEECLEESRVFALRDETKDI